MDLFRLVFIVVLGLHQARISVVKAQNGTTFNFPTFTSDNQDSLLLSGDAVITYTESLIWLNELGMGCGSVLYAEPIRMRGTSTNSSSAIIASFSTSFTFSILGSNSAGFAFAFLPENRTTGLGGGQLCLLSEQEAGDAGSQFFAIEFDTWKNPEYNDPSNNHVGVNINNMNSSATYNLCGAGSDNCSYLVSDYATSIFDSGNNFTSWIDFDSVTQSLSVFLTNGSTMRGAKKPASAIIQVSVNLSDVMNENMFVGFSGSVSAFEEVKKIKSWSFSTSFNHTQGSPTSGPSLSPGRNNAPAPTSTGGSGSSNGSTAKLAVGITVVGVAGLFAMFILYKVNKVFRRPLHFFLSHTGGKDQGGKNLPDWIYHYMTTNWKLKRFIKVFFDRECLLKGEQFPKRIMLELEKTEVGIVVVTPDFFTRKWPMIELISFMKSQDKNPAVKILPLFYKMPVSDVRVNLRDGFWEEQWKEMTDKDNEHPLVMEECHDAVKRLCNVNGIEYHARTSGYDREYIELVMTEVGKIVRGEIWKR